MLIASWHPIIVKSITSCHSLCVASLTENTLLYHHRACLLYWWSEQRCKSMLRYEIVRSRWDMLVAWTNEAEGEWRVERRGGVYIIIKIKIMSEIVTSWAMHAHWSDKVSHVSQDTTHRNFILQTDLLFTRFDRLRLWPYQQQQQMKPLLCH